MWKVRKHKTRRCLECGKVKLLSEFHRHRTNKRDGCQSICKICTKKRYKEWNQTKRGRFSRYKRSAKEKNIEFDLTFEQFITFWQKPCYYCGSPIKTIGLDRVDYNKGYEVKNLVPCCFTCNAMKSSIFNSKEDFIAHCKKIAKCNM